MVVKTVQMQIPILVSRSGFTASGVNLARKAELTLIGRQSAAASACCPAPNAQHLMHQGPTDPPGTLREKRDDD